MVALLGGKEKSFFKWITPVRRTQLFSTSFAPLNPRTLSQTNQRSSYFGPPLPQKALTFDLLALFVDGVLSEHW